MRITVAGTGYVGLSLAVLLAQRHEVRAFDLVQEKVDMINSGVSPIVEENITRLLEEGKLNLKASTDKEFAYSGAELVIVATPTNYDENTQFFDTSSIDCVVEDVLKYCPEAIIMVKSTVPVGFTKSMRSKYNIDNIYFSPEFLREGRSLYDNLHPSRIVVGDKGKVGQMFAYLLKEASLDTDTPVVLMDPTEAEAVKLFANTYLAMRVAYFNELDNYATKLNLNTEDIILGASLDPRIGNYFNNPSFGYGGACFPKDTKQLKANFDRVGVANDLIKATVNSNASRKQFIANDIMNKYPEGVIGFYKTAMKANSDNNRCSSIIDVIKLIIAAGREVVAYDPANDLSYLCKQVDTFDDFKANCAVIVTNRLEDELDGCEVYTRDIFRKDS